MKNAYQQHHAALTRKIIATLPESTSPTQEQFIAQFYAKVPASDLERMSPDDAVALAASAFEFMQKREPDRSKIRIFTPSKKNHGYESKHTVVEFLNDDMPFLIDSLTAELARHGLTIRQTLHPLFAVKRSKKGEMEALADNMAKNGFVVESLIHFEVSSLPERLSAEELRADLEWVLQHIRVAVDDWRRIVAKVDEQIAQLGRARAHDEVSLSETKDFLRWLTERNFVFLGYSEYDLAQTQKQTSLTPVADSRLGILKITDDIASGDLAALPPEVQHFLQAPQLIEITKSNRRSPVHRCVPMDYIGLKRFDAKGKVIGEARFLGLFTSNVYYQSTDDIPLVRTKVAHVMARADYAPGSHDGKALKTILEFLPRDEILQMSEDELFNTSMGIFSLEAKPGVRMFARKDTFERFVSCMVFVPKEQFSTELRRQIQDMIEKAYGGTSSEFSTQITEAPLARLRVMIKTNPGDIPHVDVAALETEIAKRAYLWSDLLGEALAAKFGEAKGERLQRAYAQAFPQGYINRYGASAGAHDIGKIEAAMQAGELSLELFQLRSEDPLYAHLKIYNPHEQIALSDILPMLENAGFRVIEEHPFQISLGADRRLWIRDFRLKLPGSVAFEQVREQVEEVLLSVWQRRMENDRFNALALVAGLSWREVVCLRAYAKYFKQAGFLLGQATIEQALGQNAAIARTIMDLFHARFAPDMKGASAPQQKLLAMLEQQLARVTSAVDDRILRRYIDVIGATLRTNFYQTESGGGCKPVLSFKFDSAKVPELPKPRPFREIFVYGVRVEGIHLRGGKVARGGLRWSDRHDDFRTEVLGLMKAQMVKNSVIVPVGSKGGFVVKQPPAAREAYLEEGVACYKMYLSGLLDITDNIIKGKITPPAQVVRHDEDDPYLVVAADKGTATFSDIANSVSAAYGFWLGDAFASGGSAGYDHKKMAITARGAWVSVTRHFHEMGIDIAKDDFTVVGIGDMSGDVFGNGMLLSGHIRLLAAFNHMHVFIDPSPDAKKSFAERQRLFALPRSTWKDYDEKLLSKGGGIFERSAKSIDISKEAQAALGLSKSKYAPEELIHAILQSPVDLLWNGGIGTYVKAEDETHEQVGDRANNGLRVNGKELRCKVVGEGGNLGFTQKGRIEYARAGGRINTDAIDNSAGVDCSDHEVNIKIAFSALLSSGKLTLDKRDKILVKMTDDVAGLVLKDNILQTQALSITEHQGAQQLESQQRLIHLLERQGLLDRAIEFLPSDKQLSDLQSAGRALTRPELAVLLAYSKMDLYKLILESTLPDEDYFLSDLKRYFPRAMQQDFAGALEAHPLKREIIATVMTNSIVNRAGMTFYSTIAQDLNVPARDIATAYAIVRDAFGLRGLWNEIEASLGIIDPATQAELYGLITRFLALGCVWLLRNLPLPLDVAAIAKDITPAIAGLEKQKAALLKQVGGDQAAAALARYQAAHVPASLAEGVLALDVMASAFDIIEVSKKTKLTTAQAASLYFELGDRLQLAWLRSGAEKAASFSHWERQAIQAAIGDLYDEQRRLTIAASKHKAGVDGWAQAGSDAIARFDGFMKELRVSEAVDLSKLMVALRYIKTL